MPCKLRPFFALQRIVVLNIFKLEWKKMMNLIHYSKNRLMQHV